MINNFDDIVIGLSDVIGQTAPLLRNKQLFYAGIEKAFYDLECNESVDMQKRISERVKDGLALLFNDSNRP